MGRLEVPLSKAPAQEGHLEHVSQDNVHMTQYYRISRALLDVLVNHSIRHVLNCLISSLGL